MNEQTPEASRASELRPGWTVHPQTPLQQAPPNPQREEATNPPESQIGSVVLMLLGVLGGLYLLYTWAWFVIADAYAGVNDAAAGASGTIGSVLQQIVFWVAPLAPITWFLSAYLATKKRSGTRFVITLVIGAIVLLPLPILFGG